ncbi:hypothetical protein K144312032_12460 [Clostridium tetani]|uniref:hypothetical protein n=1 Tax=Clostridium tetani TaxID=1513 RepID=UPI0013E90333|nr:hypothetical protein [Clostridium tetani]BDR67018.1 hypothetical protein K144312032_12460 [Clostridium tetani]
MNSYEKELNRKLEELNAKLKTLNKYGIYTKEELYKAAKEKQIDIGIFTTPLKDNANF